MSINTKRKFLNGGVLEIEGSFDLNSSAAVLSLAQKDGTTKTVRGEHMSVAKNGTGTYDITVKLASSLDGQPVFNLVESPLRAHAALFGPTLATAITARVSAVAKDSNGNIKITVFTTTSAGAAVDTTGAITVTFAVSLAYDRMGGVM